MANLLALMPALALAAALAGPASSGSGEISIQPVPGPGEETPDMTRPAPSESAVDAAGGQLLVRFEDDLSTEEIARINARLGVEVVNRMMDGRLVLVEVPYVAAMDGIEAAYRATDGVRHVERQQVYRAQGAPR